MTPERWRKLEALFHEALKLQGEARAAHLAKVCGDDEQLRAEAERLIAASERESSFLDSPIFEQAAELTDDGRNESPVGSRIGPYQVTSLLGRGGMGEVYRALDTRLGREVAIKLLPAAFSTDQDRLRRFEQEARAAGRLNHPNVLTIYDIGTTSPELGGAPYIVSELLTGETLRERLREGALPLRRAVDYAVQIARGLQAAHEKGIVHRDLKPENLFLTKDGRVKILDFGLAKLKPPTGPMTGMDTKASTRPLGTAPGVVMGTVGYMSPEQVRAEKEVDQRSDIFAFGAILYEMLSGRRAFEGRSAIEVLNAILKEEPPEIAESGREVLPALARVMRHCLEKEPAERFQSIGDAAFYLDAIVAEADSKSASQAHLPAVPTATRRSRERLAWATAMVLLIAFVSVLVLGTRVYLWRAPLDTRVYRASILPPADASIRAAPAARFALSPDGRRLAFVAVGADGLSRLWVRSLDEVSAQALAGTEGAAAPFWSPDGRYLGFFAQGKLKKVAVSGGPPLTLADAQGATGGGWSAIGGAWNRDDVILFAENRAGLYRVSAAGGTPVPVTTLDTAGGESNHWFPFFLPDGRHFLYLAMGSRTGGPFDASAVYVSALESHERKLLIEGGSNAQYAEGYLLFLRQDTLMAQPFDAERRELTGEAVALAEQVDTGYSDTKTGAFSVSPTGVLAYQAGSSRPRSQLVWFDRTGRQLGVLGDQAHYGGPELSPDGGRAAVAVRDPATETRDIWLFDLARGVRTRFTFGTTDEHYPVWSPDGGRIVFASGREGSYDLYQKASNGTGTEQLLLHDSLNKYPLSWSADGRFILYRTGGSTPQTRMDLWVLPLFGDRKPFPFLQTRFNELEGQFSPNGHWLAYQSNESGRMEVYVAPFPTPSGKWQISADGGSSPRWHGAGSEIYYLALNNKLMAAEVNSRGSTFGVGVVRPLFELHPDASVSSWAASADGQRFLVNTIAEEATAAPLTLVINWTAGLARPR